MRHASCGKMKFLSGVLRRGVQDVLHHSTSSESMSVYVNLFTLRGPLIPTPLTIDFGGGPPKM